jgi:glucose-1-phosphate thymidylyltransferase
VPRDEGAVEDSRVEGRVAIESGARVQGSVVRGPAIIGAEARVIDAYIGPYTSVGEGVEIVRSEIEHSIILEGSRVIDLGTRMEASLLGRNVRVERSNGMPKTIRLMVGDNSEVGIV